ncbi:MAG: PAS domain S-box protein [Myxococcales bacterium]
MSNGQPTKSELQRVREVLQESHGNLLSALELAEDGYAFTLDGVVVWANSALARMLGKASREVLDDERGDSVRDRIDVEAAAARVREAASTGQRMGKGYYDMRRSDGSFMQAEASTVPFELQGHRLALSSIRDVTGRVRTQRALEHSEWSLRESQRIAHVGSWLLNLQTRELTWSPEIYNIFERDPETFQASYDAFLEAVHPDDRDAVDAAYRASLDSGRSYEITHRLRMPDGRIKHVQERGETLYDDAGKPRRTLGTVQDVTTRVEFEQQLRRERNFSATVLQHMGGLVVVLDRDGAIRGFNRAAERLSGYTFDEVQGRRPWELLLPPEEADRVRQEAFDAVIGDPSAHPAHYVNVWLTRDGRRRVIEWSNVLLFDEHGEVEFMIALGIDITERTLADQRIKAQLAEKEVLLKEIHHRVKNNLQVISSMLFLQAERTDVPEVAALLEESRDRVRAMALVHETLYEGGDLARVDFKEYVERLTRGARVAYQEIAERIDVELDVQAATLSLDVAIPCGLIVSELLANAFKHAFPDGRRGRVRICFECGADADTLNVTDDGVGIPEQVPGDGRTLGIELVRALVGQLGGELEIARSGGSSFTVRMPASH